MNRLWFTVGAPIYQLWCWEKAGYEYVLLSGIGYILVKTNYCQDTFTQFCKRDSNFAYEVLLKNSFVSFSFWKLWVMNT